MAVPPPRLIALALCLAGPAAADPVRSAASPERVALGSFSIDRTEATIARFEAFAAATGRVTAAEAAGGGHEWSAGWERRPGWTVRTPFGTRASTDEPAVHVTWYEARDVCAHAGGRLPTRAEWEAAAYTELASGRRYPYPTGDGPAGANVRGEPWPRHAPAGATAAGINGLHDMGGNVWEWLADRDGDAALTAGGSWWYGPDEMRAEAMQWKPADATVVYIGFRCAYDLP